MSDTENPGFPDEPTEPTELSTPTEPTEPIAPSTPYGTPAENPLTPPSGYEPTIPVEPTQPLDAPPAYAPAPYQQPYGQTPYGQTPYGQVPYGAPQPAYQQQAPAPTARAGLPGWTWPVIAVLALLLGLGGGFLGGTLASDDATSSGGVLKVERRSAQPLPADNESIAAVAQKMLPSTVQIIAEFGGRDRGATGSGFVLDSEGHVVTNNHVIADAAKDDGPIDVIDQSGKHHKATVVGRSPVYDLAVLKIDGASGLKPAAIGSADQMRVGETVVAVGSPLALSASVTSGIVSAKNRPVTTGEDSDDASFINAIQTDAAINPGNSGGPLANLQGEVIGVNSAIATLGSRSGEEGSNIGIGFAIPIEQVQVTADQILRTGKAQYPVIGVSVRGTEDGGGAKVQEINSGTPAARSDLKVGDVITAVDGVLVSDQTDVVVAIRSHLVTDTVTLTVKRGGKELEIRVGLIAKDG